MSERRRVVLVGRGAPERGGIATFLQQLVDHHDELGADVELLNLTREGDMGSGGALSIDNVRRTVGDTRAVRAAAARADVVHIHSALAPHVTLVRVLLLTLAARSAGASVVVHAHGGRLVSFAESRSSRLLIRTCLAPAHTVVAVADKVARTLVGAVGPERVRHLPNGIDLDGFPAAEAVPADGPPTILYVGHLSERKGVLDLVEASELLRARGVEHVLELLGGRPDEGEAEYRRVRNAVGDRARLLGTVDRSEIGQVYRRADVFCLPSWWEAMPLSILEAMSSAKPVVATSVGDVPRVVEHGATGMLVEPKRPADLADALETLLTDRERREAMGRAGRARAESSFDAATMYKTIADVYRDAS